MDKRLLQTIILTAVFACFFNCNKTTLVTNTQLRVINVYPGSQAQDMRLDGTLKQPTAITYGLKNAYYSIQPGTYNFTLAPTGTNTYNTNDNIDFTAGRNYLMYLVNVGGVLQPEVAQININTLGSDTSEMRFFNFSPNSPYVDVAMHLQAYYNPLLEQNYTDTTYAIYSSRYYNDQYDYPQYKNFTLLPSGTYGLLVRYADTTIAVDTMQVTLAPGTSYTFYTRGYTDSSASVPPLVIDSIVH
jgi:hypothetical protein